MNTTKWDTATELDKLKMMDQHRSGSTVLLVLSDAAKVEELQRKIAQKGNLANVKVVERSDLDGINGRKITHIAVDEVDHLSFEVDSSLASVLDELCERSPDDFRREMMNDPVPEVMKIVSRSVVKAGLLDVSMDMFLRHDGGGKRGKFKGRRAQERGWRR